MFPRDRDECSISCVMGTGSPPLLLLNLDAANEVPSYYIYRSSMPRCRGVFMTWLGLLAASTCFGVSRGLCGDMVRYVA